MKHNLTRHLPLISAVRTGVFLALILGAVAALATGVWGDMPPKLVGDDREILDFQAGQPYTNWKRTFGWTDLMPFSDSTKRFRIEDNSLVMASQGESFLIGKEFKEKERKSLMDRPYMRFVMRVESVPEGARLVDDDLDDAAFRLYVLYEQSPMKGLAYVWGWDQQVGDWTQPKPGWIQDFSGIHSKTIGTGKPPGQWWTVEVDLRRDFQMRFPGQPLRPPIGLGLKTDSNDLPGTQSQSRLRSIQFSRKSLREEGLTDGAPYSGTLVFFR